MCSGSTNPGKSTVASGNTGSRAVTPSSLTNCAHVGVARLTVAPGRAARMGSGRAA
ncbi:hypothetical protein GCM10027614_26070 [Micromonospora vulcania]